MGLRLLLVALLGLLVVAFIVRLVAGRAARRGRPRYALLFAPTAVRALVGLAVGLMVAVVTWRTLGILVLPIVVVGAAPAIVGLAGYGQLARDERRDPEHADEAAERMVERQMTANALVMVFLGTIVPLALLLVLVLLLTSMAVWR